MIIVYFHGLRKDNLPKTFCDDLYSIKILRKTLRQIIQEK